MGKFLGIDYGRRWTGVALSDEDGSFAFPKEEIEEQGLEKLCRRIAGIAEAESVKGIVVGIPGEVPGVDKTIIQDVKDLGLCLETAGFSVSYENEMFTSKMAEALPGKPHSSAAALILQSFLDKRNRLQ